VLAVIGTLGKKQFEAFGLTGATSTRAAAQGAETKGATDAVMGRARDGATAAGAARVEGTVAEQSRGIQGNVRNAVNAAVEQGAARSAQEPK
jgi:hypothetical protein